MNTVVIYHANCTDGFGAAYVAWDYYGDKAEYLPCQYGKQAAEFDVAQCKDKDVYILDFSFPADKMAEISRVCRHLTWLDHHKTAFEAQGVPSDKPFELDETYKYTHLNPDKSGAILTWEYFNTSQAPTLLKLIDDYDRWQFKDERTKAVNKALWSHAPWSFLQWVQFMTYDPNCYNLNMEGRSLLRAHDQNVAAVIKSSKRKCAIPFEFEVELLGLACNCPSHLTSDVGHQLANESGTYGLCWHVNKDNLVIGSLRSNNNYDVSAVAKVFGGGGHKNAAGFTTTIQAIMEWTK